MTQMQATEKVKEAVKNAGFRIGMIDYNEIADVITVDSYELNNGRSLYGSAFFAQAKRINGEWKFYANNKAI